MFLTEFTLFRWDTNTSELQFQRFERAQIASVLSITMETTPMGDRDIIKTSTRTWNRLALRLRIVTSAIYLIGRVNRQT